MEAKIYTPAEVEKYTSWTAAGLRDLRNKGYTNNYGSATAGGRWRYSGRDVVAFWLAARLQDCMKLDGAVNLASAFAVAWAHAPQVIAYINDAQPAYRYTVVLTKPPVEAGVVGGSQVVNVGSLAEVEDRPKFRATSYDWKELAEAAPMFIKAIAADEG